MSNDSSKYEAMRAMREAQEVERERRLKQKVSPQKVPPEIRQEVARTVLKAIAISRTKPPDNPCSLLDGSAYEHDGEFDQKHYNAWYQKHVYRPRKKAEKAR